jgi:hypothetical protein
MPTPEPNRYGAAAERWFALWTTQYRLERDERGRAAAGFAGVGVPKVREVRTHVGAVEGTEPGA